jgi:hypothetical protein
VKKEQARKQTRKKGECSNEQASFLGHEVFCYFFSGKKSKRIPSVAQKNHLIK